MFKYFLRFYFLVSLFFLAGFLHAQEKMGKEPPQMADGMRSDGKIYVVVAVLVIILTGVFIYLIQLDRKVSRLEKKNN